MAEMIGMPEIAKRLKVDSATVRRLIARESEALQLDVHRGQGG
jgi:DNA-binding MarR family transcriptional regulator